MHHVLQSSLFATAIVAVWAGSLLAQQNADVDDALQFGPGIVTIIPPDPDPVDAGLWSQSRPTVSEIEVLVLLKRMGLHMQQRNRVGFQAEIVLPISIVDREMGGDIPKGERDA